MELDILRKILRPIIRFCVQHSLPIQEFMTAVKALYIEVAAEEIKSLDKKVNVSRIAVSTGLHREEVRRLFKGAPEPNEEEPVSVLSKVMARWRHDNRFRTKHGQPRILTIEGEDNEFKRLCALVNKSLSSGTILFELERMRYVERSAEGIKLLKEMHGFEKNQSMGYALLSKEIDTIIDSVEENLTKKRPLSNLHVRTEYDNIRVKSLPLIRRWLIDEGKEFHRKIREFLSKHDYDLTPDEQSDGGGGGKVSVSAFSLTSWSDTITEEDIPKKESSIPRR